MAKPVTGRLVCPQCKARVEVPLAPVRDCPECESADAWERFAAPGRKLVIDSAAIAEAKARRADPGAGESWFLKARRAGPAVAALGLGAAAVVYMVALFDRMDLGPLAPILEALRCRARAAALLGGGALVVGVTVWFQLRRGRLYRAWPLVTCAALGILAGASAGIVGGLHWVGAAGLGWDHVRVPGLDPGLFVSPQVRSIARATTVILAPDREGNARGLCLGAGAVIHADRDRAWIVTCSHVAMPYAAVGAVRDPETAQPVWVYFSDGRNVEGRVRWTAPPPLDVAVVSAEIVMPPAPIPVSKTAKAMDRGTGVAFVPNPLRSGWKLYHGIVLKRKSHFTPAGEYSTLYTDLPVQPGDSGTGLFDSRGTLIGLNTWASAGAEGPIGISLPSEAMQKILELIEMDALK